MGDIDKINKIAKYLKVNTGKVAYNADHVSVPPTTPTREMVPFLLPQP